jgi:hypothetical protein
MRGGLGDALIGVAALLLATFMYAISRALGYKPSAADFGDYVGMSVSLIIGGFIIYVILGVAVSLAFGVWLWPFGPS